MIENSIKNKKILITGITGFVGYHLAKKLRLLGANVYGIAKSEGNKKILKVNMLDYSTIEQFIREKKISICYHLAAESLVESGQKNPYHVFKVNTEGTLNILEAARVNKLEKVIIASTSHVYGKSRVPYFEGYTPRPSRPYETSKACADLIAQSYYQTFNLPVLIPRFINIYGPGDLNFQRLIPKTIKSVLAGSPPNMWGGRAIRDYLFIDDAIEAYLLLAKINIKEIGENRVFNFGSSNVISVEDLIKKIIKITGKNLKIKKVSEKREGEIEAQYASFRKATRMLKWEPKISLDEGLKRTIAWYSKYIYNKR